MTIGAWKAAAAVGVLIFGIGMTGGCTFNGEAETEVSDHRRIIGETSRYIGGLEREKALLAKRVDTLEKKLQIERETVPGRIEARIRKLSDEKESLEEQVLELKAENGKAREHANQNKALSEHNARLAATSKTLETTCRSQEEKIERLHKETQAMEALETEKRQVAEKNQALIELNASLKKRITELEAAQEASQQMAVDHEKFKSENTALQKAHLDLQKHLADLGAEVENARRLVTENQEMKKKIEDLTDLKDAMKLRLEQIEKKMHPKG